MLTYCFERLKDGREESKAKAIAIDSYLTLRGGL
jgi:hypothetical protein